MSNQDRSIPSLLGEIEELHPVRSSGVVRLPELIGVPFTRRVQTIVDHPHFQRLRKVRQLSLSYLVYPGAVHTRFEHSLGVFETTTRYLSALLTNRTCRYAQKRITRRDIESLLLASLLHDIGHYPFAHLLEDWVGEVADHAELLRLFLDGAIGKLYSSLKLPEGVASLSELIARDWPEASIRDICYFVSGDPGEQPYPEEIAPFKSLLRSILDGPVDSDKLDYLYRDSIHCGVPYGRFIDRDRFFQGLSVADARPDTIAIHEKGRISMELFAYARSAMFSEVYWHHTSRAITAMLNRAFGELMSKEQADRRELMDLVFARSDEEVVNWLAHNAGDVVGELMGLINKRLLYKRLLVIQKPVRPTLFSMLDRIKFRKTEDFHLLQERFVQRINESDILESLSIRPLRGHELIIDVPRQRSGLPDVPILLEHAGHPAEEDPPLGVWTGIKQDFERWVRKIRVFCHPDFADSIRSRTGYSRPSPELVDRLINILSECAWEVSQGGE